ncbi:hypothetical protein LguiA_023530 [Lonicera macranthoides]
MMVDSVRWHSHFYRNHRFSSIGQRERSFPRRPSDRSPVSPQNGGEFFRPISLSVVKSLLQRVQESSVGDFCLAICLGMDRRTIVILYSMTFTKISEEITIKLFAIISDQNLWEAETTDDISPYKALNFHSGDGG